VFNNDVLARISNARPATRDELAAISGVGPTKLADWGADILHIVATHSDH
jgi:superfamily II DNA helicase RecQ